MNVSKMAGLAGLTCAMKNTPKEKELELNEKNARTYRKKDETDRDLKRGEVRVKDYNFYNRKDSLWNDY